MHVPGCHPGTCPNLVPGPRPPHVDGQVPVPRNEDDDNRNDLGADLVLTYGPHAQEQSDNTSSGAEGSRTGGSGQVRIILIS